MICEEGIVQRLLWEGRWRRGDSVENAINTRQDVVCRMVLNSRPTDWWLFFFIRLTLDHQLMFLCLVCPLWFFFFFVLVLALPFFLLRIFMAKDFYSVYCLNYWILEGILDKIFLSNNQWKLWLIRNVYKEHCSRNGAKLF